MTLHRSVLVLYWLVLVAGLVFFTAIRSPTPASFVPLWIGVLGGTLLGHVLALNGFPFWIAAVMSIGVGANLLLVPLTPFLLSLAFVPATLCGWWSLSDRGGLAAFWFPSVIWMLSILDRTGPHAAPDRAGVVLLGGLAVAFIAFLRVRETRRTEMWRTIATVPVAAEAVRAVRRERPTAQLARAGWGLFVSMIAFAITAWIAPRLWRTESFEGGTVIALETPGEERPCCRPAYDVEPPRSRVKEYFDIGRGFDDLPRETHKPQCRICADRGIDDLDGESVTRWSPGAPEPTSVETVAPAPREAVAGGVGSWIDPSPPIASHVPPPPVPSASPSEIDVPAARTPPVAPRPPVAVAPTPPKPAPPPAPIAEPPPAPPPTPSPATSPPPPAPAASVPPPPDPAREAAPPPPAASSAPAPERADGSGLALLHWITLLVAAGLLFQLVNLGLRPLRRWIVLRHLRRPFWDETVDQRASNAWQLALIGLRDAGWRATSGEAPREFARRAGVDGLERCATILERVRHGIRLDAGDLDEMRALADTAYASARTNVGGFSRALSWLRWPLT